jgi:hypothetical protein
MRLHVVIDHLKEMLLCVVLVLTRLSCLAAKIARPSA